MLENEHFIQYLTDNYLHMLLTLQKQVKNLHYLSNAKIIHRFFKESCQYIIKQYLHYKEVKERTNKSLEKK